MHRQTWASVNVHVDEGVAGLVEALSLFPQLQTLESCEGAAHAPAWICFLYGPYWESPWRFLSEFVFEQFGPALIARVGDNARLSVRITESGNILGEIEVKKSEMADVESAIRLIATEFTAARRHS